MWEETKEREREGEEERIGRGREIISLLIVKVCMFS